MPEARDVGAETDTETVVDTTVIDTAPNDTDASSPAVSSPADDQGANDAASEPKSTLDIVRSVTRAKPEPAATATPAGGKKDETAPDAAEGKPDATKDELPPFHQHPRWKEKQAEVVQLRSEVQSLQAPAKQYRALETFMQNNQLSTEDVTNALYVGTLVRNNPAQAVEVLEEMLDNLRAEIGDVLPDDLAKEVADGFITEERALELSRARAEAKRATSHADTVVKTTKEKDQQAEAQAKATAIAKDLSEAVATWEADERKRDPSFAKKQPFIVKAVQAELARRKAAGKPVTTKAEAREVLDLCRNQVNTDLKAILPAPAPRRQPHQSGNRDQPTRGSGGGAGGGKKLSTLDIVRNRGSLSD